ncbi:hypothetical protein [Acidimangrovimonas pyrenivorans]|uniref:Uncharacterized protein n=1 Tax=Acidimangrovimonas pyrenivorans TaxID=2030798 RepID=A0ABV7AGZ8_9RHOB
MMTPIDLWRASFAFWTRAYEAQMEATMQMMAATGLWRVTDEETRGSRPELPPNAVSVPKPKVAPQTAAPKPAAARPTRPATH